MKSLNYLSIILVMVAVMLSSYNVSAQGRGKKVKWPIKHVRTNNKFFRAMAMGESSKEMNSRRKALHNAKVELITGIETHLKGYTKNYVKDLSINEQEAVTDNFQQVSKEVFDASLYDISVIQEKTRYNKKKDKYKTYISIEVPKKSYHNNLKNAYKNQISKDEEWGARFDEYKFDKEFDKAIKEYEDSHNN